MQPSTSTPLSVLLVSLIILWPQPAHCDTVDSVGRKIVGTCAHAARLLGLEVDFRLEWSLNKALEETYRSSFPEARSPKLFARDIILALRDGDGVMAAVQDAVHWELHLNAPVERLDELTHRFYPLVRHWLDTAAQGRALDPSIRQMTKLRAAARRPSRTLHGSRPRVSQSIFDRLLLIKRFSAAELQRKEIAYDRRTGQWRYVDGQREVPSGFFYIAMGLDGKIYITEPGARVNHASFGRLGPLAFAGEIGFDEGRLEEVRDRTGHYWQGYDSPTRAWAQFLRELRRRRVPLKGFTIGVTLADPSREHPQENTETLPLESETSLGRLIQEIERMHHPY